MKLTTIFVAFPLLSHAFLPLQQSSRHATERYLDPKIADMIDNELHRLHHKKDFEREWMEKNRQAVVASFENPLPEPVVDTDFRQRRKDESLARKDPARYCADRCVSTGNCDVYEDFFEFSPEQVLDFCNDCVLAEDEEPCPIPDAFFDHPDGSHNTQLKP